MSDENENFPAGYSPDESAAAPSEFNTDEISVRKGMPPEQEHITQEHITTEDDIELPDFLNSEMNSGLSGGGTGEFPPPAQDEFDPDADYTVQQEAVRDAGNGNPYAGHLKESAGERTDSPVQEARQENGEDRETAASGIPGNTMDKEESLKFTSKISADDADRKAAGKPRILNKKFLLAAIIIVLGSVFIITFLMPAKKKNKGKVEKPVAEAHRSTDYASLASRPPAEEQPDTAYHYEDINAAAPKKEPEEVEIPPVIQNTGKQPYAQQNINYSTGKGGGSGSGVEIPDTRNDSLQGKSISGIKGLTSTQPSYSTDYQQTVAKNTSSGTPGSGFSMPSKEEYMSNILGAYNQAYGSTGQNNSYAAQNDQSGKNSFYSNGRNSGTAGQGEFLNLNTVWQGTIFEATLTSELNTDLPGEITARISKNIYNSQDGRYLLIPQNSIVYGTYNSSISYSQSRVQVAWHTLVRPDGYQIQLGNMNGTDAKGASGLKGTVNDHPLAYLKAIGLMSVFSIVNSEFESAMGDSNNQYVQNVMANSQQVTMELADKLIDRAMNVQPTIKIKAGTKINIVVNQNLALPPCQDIPVTQPYRKY